MDNNIFIDDHTCPITNLYWFKTYTNINYKIIHVEDNLSMIIKKIIHNYYDITNINFDAFYNTTNKTNYMSNTLVDFENYNKNDWLNYYSINGHYDSYYDILKSNKDNIYKIYKDDFVNFDYPQKYESICVQLNLPKDFNWEIYKSFNGDLKSLNKIQTELHYINYGCIENRKYKYEHIPDDFDANTYIDINGDLLGMTEKEAIIHYECYGYFEKRTYKIMSLSDYINIPIDFVPRHYLLMYEDLNGMNEDETIKHYNMYGYKEYRKYKYVNVPNDFNWKKYIKLNQDLENMNEKDAYEHYNFYGKKENRKYNDYLIYSNKDTDEFEIFNFVDEQTSNNFDVSDLFNLIDSFILYFDINGRGGGTLFFTKSIILRYKKYNNFLIITNVDGINHLHLNNEYLVGKFNDDELIYFFEQHKHKIINIFINHIIDHSPKVLQYVFAINTHVTTITHDYSLVLNIHNPYYCEINQKNQIDKSIFNINKCNLLISQNINTLNNYLPFIDDNLKCIISPLPDYRYSDEIIENSQNDILVIAMIGLISEVKGKFLAKNIIEKYNNNPNIKFVVFGKLELNNFSNYHIYNNLDELNLLIKTYKPHIIVETSIWPETYSYTLTLSKIMDIPILCYNKPFVSVVKNRLDNYDKKYFFTSVDDFDTIIQNIKLEKYIHTISNKLYYNSFWDELFISNKYLTNTYIIDKNILTTNKNIVLITSKIIVSNVNYTYSSQRSIYTTEERYLQTIDTVETVRKYIPNTYIVLIDNSTFEKNYFDKLNSITDLFINMTDNKLLNYYTDQTTHKFLGELCQQIIFYDLFFKNFNINSINYLFKISGRYFINDNFDFSKYNNEHNIFKKNLDVIDREYLYTSFYKFNKNILKKFYNNLIYLFNDKHFYMANNYDYEVITTSALRDDITLVDTLGITEIKGPFLEICDI